MHSALLARRSSLAAVGLVFALGGCSSNAEPGDGVVVGQSESGLSANDKIAFDYFLGKGLTNFQAAGIVGNLDQESSMNPGAVQAGGPGRGIAQWSVGGRWDTDSNDNAKAFAAKEGQPLSSLSLQLDFIWYELTTFSSYGLAPLRASTNVTDATIAFEKDFEGCGTCAESQRIAYAKAALAAYGNDKVDGSAPPADAGTSCFVPSLNATGECILTSACAARPNHVSTPGFCPGAADIECCTGPSDDAGAHDASSDSATPPGHPGSDSGAAAPSGDPDGGAGDDGGAVPYKGSGFVDDSGMTTTNGCAVSRARDGGGQAGTWLFGLALVAIARRRRTGARWAGRA
jgi:hypothetical protein